MRTSDDCFVTSVSTLVGLRGFWQRNFRWSSTDTVNVRRIDGRDERQDNPKILAAFEAAVCHIGGESRCGRLCRHLPILSRRRGVDRRVLDIKAGRNGQ
ncbi:MAG: hypothetical protein WB554_13100 [Desulfomonilaceae bacterium]